MEHYDEALRSGQREYRSRLAKGEYPFLPALDDLIPLESQAGGLDMGIIEIPVEFLVGTKTNARTNAFACNFMPILPAKTEFAVKWENLAESYLQEGIREPVKAYEYMNRFYVEEGNKRVSVLKFFGAVSVTGRVRRIMPQADGSRNVTLYLEFVHFNRLSRINFVEFTKFGSFAELQERIGFGPDEVWSETERNRFSSVYFNFKQAYEAIHASDLRMTVADALLAYLRIYPYESLFALSLEEMKQKLEKFREEIFLQRETEPVDIIANPDQEKKQSFLSRTFSAAPRPFRVAFIHDEDPLVSGWTNAHELGRLQAQSALGESVSSASYCGGGTDTGELIQKAIDDGNQLIFTTSPRLLTESIKQAIDHPDTVIFNCSLNVSHRYIRTYYARMYEAKFIIGAIAGSLAGSEAVGYICDYPIYGQMAGINAFALGVQLVNPRSAVVLEWSSVNGTQNALKRLTDRGIRLVSTQDITSLQAKDSASFGLSCIRSGRQQHLAHPVWNWGRYYEEIIRSVQNGTMREDYAKSAKAINYYWGMSAGVVDLVCSDELPGGTQKLAELLKNSICSGICNPFRGPINSQGKLKIAGEDHFLSFDEIVRMDWLEESVLGHIPSYDELNDKGKAIVDLVGVDAARKNAESRENV